MIDKPMPQRETLVAIDDLDDMPPAEPLSAEFRALTDDEAERRAAGDPDVGAIPPGFWSDAWSVEPETEERTVG